MSKKLDSNQLAFYSVNGQMVPDEGPRGVPLNLDYTDGSTDITLDIQNVVARKLITMVQAIFIDNAENPSQFQVSVNGLPKIKIAPGWQGYIQLLAPNPAQFTFSTNGGILLNVVLLNFPVSNCIWPSSAGV